MRTESVSSVDITKAGTADPLPSFATKLMTVIPKWSVAEERSRAVVHDLVSIAKREKEGHDQRDTKPRPTSMAATAYEEASREPTDDAPVYPRDLDRAGAPMRTMEIVTREPRVLHEARVPGL